MNTAEKIIPPAYALRAIELLEKEGFEAWFVGGCVRTGISPQAPYPGKRQPVFKIFPVLTLA